MRSSLDRVDAVEDTDDDDGWKQTCSAAVTVTLSTVPVFATMGSLASNLHDMTGNVLSDDFL